MIKYITSNVVEYENIEFPVLMKEIGGDMIVLFRNKKEGTVVVPPSSYDPRKERIPGFYYDNWNIKAFEVYNGEVTLLNE